MIEDRLYGVRELYESSPLWLRRAAGALYCRLPNSLRYGPVYGQMRALLQKTRHLSREELEALTNRMLQRAIADAYAHVPFYRSAMKERGVEPRHIRRRRDLRLLPLVDKTLVRESGAALRSEIHGAGQRIYVTTGGSTGEPVGFDLQAGVCRPKEAAMLDHAWSLVGYRRSDRSAIVRGSVLNREGICDEDPIKRSLVLSSYHLSDQYLPRMITALRRFQPRYLQAYPSSAEILARHLRATGQPPIQDLRALLLSSETLRPDQRQLLQEAFRCRVFSWYGHAERVVFAAECEAGSGYHIYPEYGIFELVDEHGEVLPWEPGVRGEIVGTALWNRAMPLIRYRTYDLATVAADGCSCGRPHPRLASVEGRIQEFLIAADGRPISTTALNMHSRVFDQVSEMQFVQQLPGEVELHLVPRAEFGPADRRAILREVGRKLGRETELHLVLRTEIPTTPSGKRRLVLQQIPVPDVLVGALGHR
jgi:phenylacetate-CoA ligase